MYTPTDATELLNNDAGGVSETGSTDVVFLTVPENGPNELFYQAEETPEMSLWLMVLSW